MVNRSAKGRGNELAVIHMMVAQGYKIAFRSIRTRFQAIDYLGLFDVVGVMARDESGEGHTWYVSSKTNRSYSSEHTTALLAFRLLYSHKNDRVELWDWHDARWVKTKGSKLKSLHPRTVYIKKFEETETTNETMVL